MSEQNEIWMNIPTTKDNPLYFKLTWETSYIYVNYNNGIYRCERNYHLGRNVGIGNAAHLLLTPVNRQDIELRVTAKLQKAKEEYDRKVAEIMAEETKDKTLLDTPLTITDDMNIQEDSEELKWMFHPPY